MSQNPYDKIYQDLGIVITPDTTLAEAEILAKHLAYVYNTFGTLVKDFVTLLGCRFRNQQLFQPAAGKKDKKTANFQTRTDKKARSQDQMEQEQLEGKFAGAPPNRTINQIQKITPPSNPLIEKPQTNSNPKNLHLNNSKPLTINNPQANTLEKETDQIHNEKPQLPAQNPQPQLRDQNTLKTNTSTPVLNNLENNPPRKIIHRRKGDHQVINISSSDQQKEGDSQSGVKTRAQHREQKEQKPMMRPDSLLRRGRGRGRRGRGRPSSKSSSRIEENIEEDKKSLSSYPLLTGDPFTIIRNVPYTGKSSSSLTPGSTPSKKDQKVEKKMSKLVSSEESLQQKGYAGENEDSEGEFEGESKDSDQNHRKEKISRSFIDKDSLFNKVKAFIAEKESIEEKLNSLDKEYERQRLNLGKGEKSKEGENGEKEMENLEEKVDDEDEIMVEELEEDELMEQGEVENDNENVNQGLDDVDVQEDEEQLPFQKLNPSPKPSPKRRVEQSNKEAQDYGQSQRYPSYPSYPSSYDQEIAKQPLKPLQVSEHNHRDSYNYLQNLQKINQSIQQEFEQNLRMNHDIQDDQNNSYEEELSYESPSNYLIEDQLEYEEILLQNFHPLNNDNQNPPNNYSQNGLNSYSQNRRNNYSQNAIREGQNQDQENQREYQKQPQNLSHIQPNHQQPQQHGRIRQEGDHQEENTQKQNYYAENHNYNYSQSQLNQNNENENFNQNWKNTQQNNNNNHNDYFQKSSQQYFEKPKNDFFEKPNHSNGYFEKPNENDYFDKLFQSQVNQQAFNSYQATYSNPINPTHQHNPTFPSSLMQNHQQSLEEQQVKPSKPVPSTDSYFPFAQGIPFPSTNQPILEQPKPQKPNPNVYLVVESKQSDNQQLLKVFQAFQSDQDQPVKPNPKPPVSQQFKQAIFQKLALMTKKDPRPNNGSPSIKYSDKSPLNQTPLPNNSSLHLENSSIHQNQHSASVNATKEVQVPAVDNKKNGHTEFISILKKKQQPIEVIELQ